MNYGNIKYHAIEDGEGCRTVLFVSGCRHHCKGCFQPQTWDFDYGELFTDDIADKIIKSLDDSYVNGLTLLGGEPFEPENQIVLEPFLQKVKKHYPSKSIWAYSGYTFEELMSDPKCHTASTIPMLRMIDVLVDGEFIEKKKNLMLPYRGSDNQRIIAVQETLANWKKSHEIILSKHHFRNR